MKLDAIYCAIVGLIILGLAYACRDIIGTRQRVESKCYPTAAEASAETIGAAVGICYPKGWKMPEQALLYCSTEEFVGWYSSVLIVCE